jgi:hypothetical protein
MAWEEIGQLIGSMGLVRREACNYAERANTPSKGLSHLLNFACRPLHVYMLYSIVCIFSLLQVKNTNMRLCVYSWACPRDREQLFPSKNVRFLITFPLLRLMLPKNFFQVKNCASLLLSLTLSPPFSAFNLPLVETGAPRHCNLVIGIQTAVSW